MEDLKDAGWYLVRSSRSNGLTGNHMAVSGLESKALPFSVDNFSPFEKQLLAAVGFYSGPND